MLTVLANLRHGVDNRTVTRVKVMVVLDLVTNGLRRFVPAEPGEIIVNDEAPDSFDDFVLNDFEAVTSQRRRPRSDSEHIHRGPPQQKRRRKSD